LRRSIAVVLWDKLAAVANLNKQLMKSEVKSYLYVIILALITIVVSYLALVAYVKAIDGDFFDILDKFYWALILGLVVDSILICGIGALVHKKNFFRSAFVGNSYKLFYHIGTSVFCVALLYLFMIIIY
jgi:hypothetical protein